MPSVLKQPGRPVAPGGTRGSCTSSVRTTHGALCWQRCDEHLVGSGVPDKERGGGGDKKSHTVQQE